jgi:cell wall assembly regulator SMI1
MFEENETYHTKLKEFEKSGKSIDEWYEEEITESVKQFYPKATANDIDQVKEAVAKQIDDDSEDSINGLEYLNDLIVEAEKKEATE